MEEHESFPVPKDAFSDGQIRSKIWLARELERVLTNSHCVRHYDNIVWVLGGWVGVLPLILLSRDDAERYRHVRSFDLDPTVAARANLINNAFECDGWRFQAFTADANTMFRKREPQWGPLPHIVINTSTEHFDSDEWYEGIPCNSLVVVQGTDMDIEDHVAKPEDLDDFKNRFPMQMLHYGGKLWFSYPDKSFTRYMLIGRK